MAGQAGGAVQVAHRFFSRQQLQVGRTDAVRYGPQRGMRSFEAASLEGNHGHVGHLDSRRLGV